MLHHAVSFLKRMRSFLPNRSVWGADDGYSFFGNPLVRGVGASSLVTILAAFVAVYVFIVRGGGDAIILHYNAYFGVDIVGAPGQALLLPSMATAFFFANLVLAARFYVGRERIAAHMLLFSSLFVALSTGVAVAALSFINS